MTDLGPVRIIKSDAARLALEVEQARGRAESIVAEARASAEKIVEDARQDAARSVEQEGEKARQSGLKRGYEEALARLASSIEAFNRQLQDREEQIADIIAISVARIIGQTPPRKRLSALVHTAISDLRVGTPVRVLVPFEDVEAARLALEGLGDEAMRLVAVVAGDSILREGEVVIEMDRGRLHVGEKQQLQRLMQALNAAEGART